MAGMFGCGKWKRDDVWTGLILVAHPASDRVVVVLEVGVGSVVRDFRTGLHVSACTAYQQEIISNVLHDGFAPIPLPTHDRQFSTPFDQLGRRDEGRALATARTFSIEQCRPVPRARDHDTVRRRIAVMSVYRCQFAPAQLCSALQHLVSRRWRTEFKSSHASRHRRDPSSHTPAPRIDDSLPTSQRQHLHIGFIVRFTSRRAR